MKFTAYAETNKLGSRCETTFEIDDEALEDMTAIERNEYIQGEAMDAAWNAGIVEIGYEEPGK